MQSILHIHENMSHVHVHGVLMYAGVVVVVVVEVVVLNGFWNYSEEDG